MNDILPPEVSKWQFLEQKARDVLEAFAYRELRTPIFEHTALFTGAVGEGTDVVSKETYTFDDCGRPLAQPPPGGDGLGGAGLRRGGTWNEEPVKRWYFRARCSATRSARSAGRLRELYQVGAELFGRGRALGRRRADHAAADDDGRARRPGVTRST